jgi:hypothetical protein
VAGGRGGGGGGVASRRGGESEPIESAMVSMCKAGYAVDAGKNIQVSG